MSYLLYPCVTVCDLLLLVVYVKCYSLYLVVWQKVMNLYISCYTGVLESRTLPLYYNTLGGRLWPSQCMCQWFLTLYSLMKIGDTDMFYTAVFDSSLIYLYIRRCQKCVPCVSSSTMSTTCSNRTVNHFGQWI